MNPARTDLPVWVSLEGINGVGKTYLSRELVTRLAGRAEVLSELTDGGGDAVSAAVVSALSGGRSFLRTGHPLTETMALLALKVREHELVATMSCPPQIVIEDRGVDSVALYQAAVAADAGTDAGAADAGAGAPDGVAVDQMLRAAAERVYATAAPWRPLPALTVLLVDDPAECARRFTEREARPLARDEQRLIGRAARLYRWRAGVEPQRFRTVDRTGRGTDDVLAQLVTLVQATVNVVGDAEGPG